MTDQENIQVVRDLYAAYDRGGVAAVLAAYTDDAEIVFPGPSVLPFAGTHRGRAAIGQFFQTVGENVEIREFGADEYVAQNETVVVLGHERASARETGRGWETDWVMVFTLRDGKISRVREFHETATIAAAFGAE